MIRALHETTIVQTTDRLSSLGELRQLVRSGMTVEVATVEDDGSKIRYVPVLDVERIGSRITHIATTSGTVFTTSADQPLLTPDGWIEAHRITPGTKLVGPLAGDIETVTMSRTGDRTALVFSLITARPRRLIAFGDDHAEHGIIAKTARP